MAGSIYLIPGPLSSEVSVDTILPGRVIEVMSSLSYFVVENKRTARRYLKKIEPSITIETLTFYVLNKHTSSGEVHSFLEPALDGWNMGLLSEAGIPCVADPGADLVFWAHKKGIRVIPLVGPSSIYMALMASGLNGQKFAFNGYLPVDRKQRRKRIQQIEERSRAEHQTQLFMETPYRNNQMIDDLLRVCADHTWLCIAADISSSDAFIQTSTIAQWKKHNPDLHKRPAIYVLSQESR